MCVVSTDHPKQVFTIYAESTEPSPFHDCYATNDTVLRTCAGRFFVHDSDDCDIAAAYWALRQTAVIFDVP